MNSHDIYNLSEAYLDVYENQQLEEVYQEPRFGKKDYIKKLSKRGGMGMGTPEDPHGYRDPNMAKVGAEFSKRITAAAKAKKTGNPDSYRAEKEAQSKLKKEEVDLYDLILSHLLDEGYAETPEAAEVIMVNMSDEWREDIIDEAKSDPKDPADKRDVRGRRYVDQEQGETGVKNYDKNEVSSRGTWVAASRKRHKDLHRGYSKDQLGLSASQMNPYPRSDDHKKGKYSNMLLNKRRKSRIKN